MRGRLFGTNGVRGVVNEAMTAEVALRLGQAMGATLGGPCLVAWDGRRGTPMATHGLLAGLAAVGCDALLLGPLPTPALQFACRRRARAGVMVTASHNPPEYAGFKVVGADGIEVPRGTEEAIEAAFAAAAFPRPPWSAVGTVGEASGDLDAYLRAIVGHVDAVALGRRRPRIVVDPGHGVGALATPRLLRTLGCRVDTIHEGLDGRFPRRPPEPTPAALGPLAEAVVAAGADLGIAHDGDADRCIVVDERGRVEGGERSFALVARWFLARRPRATVVTPVSSSQVVARVAGALGASVHWTPVGSVHVSRAMAALGAPLGGEENGGILYGPHQPVRDGPMAAALFAHLLATEEAAASALFASLPRFHLAKEKVPCPPPARGRVMASLAKALAGARVETIDGLKVWEAGDRWVLLRPSGTEPVLRIFAEAPEAGEARALADRYARRVAALLAEAPGLALAGGAPRTPP